MVYDGYIIRSKPTRYGKYLFRSRLEARWAVFMDLLSIEYEYEAHFEEVETVRGSFWYKPDFYIPRLEYYIEIKPRKPTEKELGKAAGWANCIESIVIFYSLGPEGGNLMYWGPEKPRLSARLWHWSQCPRCLKIGLNDGGELDCGCYDVEEVLGRYGDIEFTRTPALMRAYSVANKYDFSSDKRAMPITQRASLF